MIRLLLLSLFVVALAACERDGAVGTPAADPLYDADGLVIEPVNADELAVEVRQIDADIVMVNFWASWCLPCREEFPDLMRYDREHPDVALRFVSLDFEDDLPFAVEFLQEQGVEGQTFLKTGRDGEFIDAVDERWTGAIPATVLYARDGTRLAFHEGKMSYNEIVAFVDAARTTGQPSPDSPDHARS